MAESALSSFWVNGSAHFTRDGLDAAAGRTAAAHAGACPACGRGRLVPGRMQDTGRLYFRPSRTRLWVLREALVPVAAVACTRCGRVEMHADTRKLHRLIAREEADAS